MGEHGSATGLGLSKPTILEGWITRIPGPFWLWVIILCIGVSVPGMMLGIFLDTLDPNQTWAVLLEAVGETPPWQFVFGAVMDVVIPLYCFAGMWFMRRRLLRAAPACVDLCSEGEISWRRAFRRLPQATPPTLITILIFVLGVPSLLQQILQTATGPAHAAWFIYTDLFFSAAGAFFIWVYTAALLGLYDLGREPLRLSPYYEDGMLGMRPLGSLSLSLSYIYFLGVGIGTATLPFSSSPLDPIVLALLLAAVAILGVFLFFLPLLRVHQHMAKARSDEIAKVRQGLLSLLEPSGEAEQGIGEDTSLRRSVALGALREEVRSIPTWPLDTTILGKLSVVALSVATVIISQFLRLLLG